MSRAALTARDATGSDRVEVVLLAFDHPALAAPLRLSTDPTTRISTDPLVYGTRSTWSGADPATDPYLFVLAAAETPSDLEDAASAARLILANLHAGIGESLRAITGRARVHLAVVWSDSPDLVEAEYRDLRLIASEGDADQITLTISRAPIEDEHVPMDRFTRDRFPGLHR